MEGQLRESEGFHSRFYFLHCDEARPAPVSTLNSATLSLTLDQIPLAL